MNWKFILSGGVFLVLAGLVGADFVSTSISTDGTMMLASSGNTENGSFASPGYGRGYFSSVQVDYR